MARSLPSCISDTFCSHKQASWLLLATLSPLFLPFLILCVPFLLLFLAPMTVFLFSLLLLYKLQVSIRTKLKLSRRRAGKGVVNEGYRRAQQIEGAEGLHFRRPVSLEEDRQFKGLEGSVVQRAEMHTHHDEGNGVGSCVLPLRVRDFEEEQFRHSQEDLAMPDRVTEYKIEEKQEQQEIKDAPLVDEAREGRTPEGADVSIVQNVELAGLQSAEKQSDFTEEMRKDMVKECLRSDRIEEDKQQEEEITEELLDFTVEQKHSPLYVDATSSWTSEENRPSLPVTDKGESLDMPEHRSGVPVEWRGQELLEFRDERLESSHVFPLEEAWGKLPAIQVTEPTSQAEVTVLPDEIVAEPGEEELKELFATDTPFTSERIEELPSKQDPEISGSPGSADKKEDVFFPAKPFEKETEEGEPSCSSLAGHGSKETGDDEQPKNGRPVKNSAESFETESFAERVEGYPYESTSSGEPLPHVSHGGIEFQDRIEEEQKIMADIYAIKKIVGYEGDPHAPLLEQISALYMFLGMEPYDWGAEVDSLERAQVEIELLKVVVGVK